MADRGILASEDAWDFRTLPGWDDDFYDEEDHAAFAAALAVPETSPSEEDLLNPKQPEFITALNDWRPIHQRVRGSQKPRHASTKNKRKRKPRRGKDEIREGWTYTVLKYPFLIGVGFWLLLLAVVYAMTRIYIYCHETVWTWRGRRSRLREKLRAQNTYQEWVAAAEELDTYLGNDEWKEEDDYAYYDHRTIRRVKDQLIKYRVKALNEGRDGQKAGADGQRAIDELRGLVEACVKNNFSGFENPRLYHETYYGTKNLVQDFVEEVSETLKFLFDSNQLTMDEKRQLAKHLNRNFGRTALCLSGGATFAYYHFGIARALLDEGLLPKIITGTSGGALVAALLATRTDDELKRLLVPALAYRIRACRDSTATWIRRWWRTGARFDSEDWAKQCAWFTHGSLTFLEAYERTGRVLNVSCVPSDPHSPTILANHITAPDCVVWSAVLASAAVPGILNPVVLMRKKRDGKLEPYSFGHKWKDGSLRTDIPLKSLNIHFQVNFSIVSQVNPHINLFFFSSRGAVGRPVTHRRGRGWRGGFLGSAIEQYVKLDLTKWLKVLRHLELLPRPMGQDWSEIWLQRFSGTVTIWPKSIMSDFFHILSDPSMERLARMIRVGQHAAWPKLRFIGNRMAIEKIIQDARDATRLPSQAGPERSPESRPQLRSMLSQEDLQTLLEQARSSNGAVEIPPNMLTSIHEETKELSIPASPRTEGTESPSFAKRFTGWFGGSRAQSPDGTRDGLDGVRPPVRQASNRIRRNSSVIAEIRRQSGVFFDDTDAELSYEETTATEDEGDTDEEHQADAGGAPYVDSQPPQEDDTVRRRPGAKQDGSP